MYTCDVISLLRLGALLVSIGISDGACTWPSPFTSSNWTDSSKGKLVFASTTMSGWHFKVGNLNINDWECYNTDYLESDGYLVMKTTNTLELFSRSHYGFLCLKLTKITDVSYRYYEVVPVQKNVNHERLLINDIGFPLPTNVTQMCFLEYGAYGSEYKVLLKTGHEEAAKIRCPYSFLGEFDYLHSSLSGVETCQSKDNMNLCQNNKEINFSYDTCPTKIAYSEFDTVWCVDSVPVDDNNYVMVYNAYDPAVDEIDTFRFSCFSVSADSRNASVTPKNCKKDQTPYSVPKDNSGVAIGATLSMNGKSTFCPPCDILSSPIKGKVSITTNGAITAATYTCINNYTIAGDDIRICQDNGTWSGINPSCTCDTPKSPTNGAVTVSADGTTAKYTCIANFTLNGDVTRTCQTETNTWTGSDPTCTPCLPLEMLANGDVTVHLVEAETGSVAVYTCNAGATLNGNSSRECQKDGQWTNTNPSCSVCPALTTSSSGTVNLTTNGIVTSATFSCAAGYTMIGQTEYTCQSDGIWDGAEPQCVCNSPDEPENGGIVILDGFSTAVYTCDSGYTINGSSVRFCQSDGNGWTGTDPTCASCQTLSMVDALQVRIYTNGTVSSASFTCDLSYTLNGHSVTLCQADGSWEYSTPICEKCMPLSTPSSGSLHFSTNGTLTIAQYICTTGSSLHGDSVVECNSDGRWTTTTTSCVTCDTLEGLQDGSYIVTSNGTTSEVTFYCSSGYMLDGNSQAICRDDGTWSLETKPVCSRNSGGESVVTERDTALLPAVIVLSVMTALLLSVSAVAIYCYCKVKKAGQPKETSGDDGVLKSIPIAAVLTSAAPLGHQKPLFDRSRSTALSTAPDGHRRNSNQAIVSAQSRSSTASISSLNLEMVRETTSSSVYGGGIPAPWSSKDSLVSGSTDLPGRNSPTLSSLYSGYSSPRRGYTPKYFYDSEDTARESPVPDENVIRETPSPKKSPKKRKIPCRKLSHADIDENENEALPPYMKDNKFSTSKAVQEVNMNDKLQNKHLFKTVLPISGDQIKPINSKRSVPKLTSPRV